MARRHRLGEPQQDRLRPAQRVAITPRIPRYNLATSGQELLTAMIQLPDRLKLVLQLFFVEELNLTEIAAVLEVSVPRVHQLRAKALKDLRALLDQP
ncbi:sigma-70 family RNA polymerase sigma factor [uncultured Erythrobacter sp.]|uniref:sigma-70 family RNA polymerase sigma factor n=1 Tax=uncultured Erythrobacter sp. TaxID=263913 RepID=UPI00374973B4